MLLVSSVAPSASWGIILLQIMVQKCCRCRELLYVAYLSNPYQKRSWANWICLCFCFTILFYCSREEEPGCLLCFCEVWHAINGVGRNRLVAVLRTRCLAVFYFYIHAHPFFVHPPTGSWGLNLTYKHSFRFWSQVPWAGIGSLVMNTRAGKATRLICSYNLTAREFKLDSAPQPSLMGLQA